LKILRVCGLEDEVDNHWGMLFRAAVLSTLLGVGAEAGASQDENNLAQAIRSGASNSISQTGQQIVRSSSASSTSSRRSQSGRAFPCAWSSRATLCSRPSGKEESHNAWP
jgi:hypothetical protein